MARTDSCDGRPAVSTAPERAGVPCSALVCARAFAWAQGSFKVTVALGPFVFKATWLRQLPAVLAFFALNHTSGPES